MIGNSELIAPSRLPKEAPLLSASISKAQQDLLPAFEKKFF